MYVQYYYDVIVVPALALALDAGVEHDSKDLRKLFVQLDADGDGTVTEKEFTQAMSLGSLHNVILYQSCHTAHIRF